MGNHQKSRFHFSRYLSAKNLLGIAHKHTELSFLSLRNRLSLGLWFALLVANLVGWGFEETYANPEVSSFFFRMMVCLFGLPLFFRPYPKSPFLKEHQRTYFVLFCTLQLPVLFSWNALANAAATQDPETLNGSWLAEYAFAIFLYLGVFSRPIFAAIISFLILLLSAGLALLVYQTSSDHLMGTTLFMIASILSAYCFLTIALYQLSHVHRQKIETAYSIGSRVAHEIRTPLLSIRNFASTADKLLTTSTTPTETDMANISSRLDYILREVAFANKTIDILLLSTTSAPFSYNPEEKFLASKVIHTATSDYPFGNAAERNCIEISNREDFETHAPAALVVNALYNLMKNAILSSSSQTETRILLTHYVEKGHGVLSVSDNGRGISPGLERKVFEDFFTTRETGDGTGLGLSFCKSLMTQLGGRIEYSRENDWSVFRMHFPLGR